MQNARRLTELQGTELRCLRKEADSPDVVPHNMHRFLIITGLLYPLQLALSQQVCGCSPLSLLFLKDANKRLPFLSCAIELRCVSRWFKWEWIR
jgi:hypothetical protein